MFGLGVSKSFIFKWAVDRLFDVPVAAVVACTHGRPTPLCARIFFCLRHVRESENLSQKVLPPMAKWQGSWTLCCWLSKPRRRRRPLGVRRIQVESRTVSCSTTLRTLCRSDARTPLPSGCLRAKRETLIPAFSKNLTGRVRRFPRPSRSRAVSSSASSLSIENSYRSDSIRTRFACP